MPVEFSVAAYRFGHSMARPSYLINDVVPRPRRRQCRPHPALLTGRRPDTPPERLPGPAGRVGRAMEVPAPADQRRRRPNDASLPQPSYKIDAAARAPARRTARQRRRARSLFAASTPPSAPGRSPSATCCAAARSACRRARTSPARWASSRSATRSCSPISTLDRRSSGPGGHAPLWFYVLKEAEAEGEGTASARSAGASSPRS